MSHKKKKKELKKTPKTSTTKIVFSFFLQNYLAVRFLTWWPLIVVSLVNFHKSSSLKTHSVRGKHSIMSRIRIGVGIMKKIPHCLCPQFAIPVSVNSWNINTWLKRSINNAAHFKWNCYRVLIQSTLCYSLTRGAAELNTDCSRCTLHIKVELQVQAYREQSRGEREIHLPLNFYVTSLE